jgi:hypothetical protein
MLAFRSFPINAWHWSLHGWHWSARVELAAAFFMLAVWSVLDSYRLVHGARRAGAVSHYLSAVDDEGGNAGGYLATYLLPFLGLIPSGWGDRASYGIYFVVATVVFVRTDLTLVNPTLYLMGWRVVSARAFLDAEHSTDLQVWPTPVVVVCRDVATLADGPVNLVRLAGCYIAKQQQTT